MTVKFNIQMYFMINIFLQMAEQLNSYKSIGKMIIKWTILMKLKKNENGTNYRLMYLKQICSQIFSIIVFNKKFVLCFKENN